MTRDPTCYFGNGTGVKLGVPVSASACRIFSLLLLGRGGQGVRWHSWPHPRRGISRGRQALHVDGGRVV